MEALYQSVWAQVFALTWANNPQLGGAARKFRAMEEADAAARDAVLSFSHAKQEAAIDAWRKQS